MVKTVCITGCSKGGIGHALALEFHARGLKVFATSRSLQSMETLKEEGIETLVLDVKDPNNIREVKAQIAKLADGKLDVLVNNAGIAYPYAVSDFSMERVRELYDVNLFGPMEMVHEFIPLLIASGDARVVNIGSLAACMPVPFNAAYNSAKAALHSFGDTLRLELAPFKVKVITVASGNVSTEIMKSETLPADSIYSPIREEYQRDRLDKFQDGAIPAQEYARAVVSETLKSNPRAWLWTGNNAWTCWLIHTFGTRTSFDSLLSGLFGLTKLTQLHKAKSI